MLRTKALPFHRISHELNSTLQLIETRCAVCGFLVAASPRLELIELVERVHVCPQFWAFAPL
jgi:hypothetical protein